MLWIVLFLWGVLGPHGSRFVSGDGDPALHILLGDLMRGRGGLLATEPTTFTADGIAFVAHEWLSQVIFSCAHERFGLLGPLIVVSALVASVGAVLLLHMRALGVSGWPRVVTVVLAMLVVNQHLLVRPHVFSWLFTTIWVWLLERMDSGELRWSRALAVIGPLAVLWTNLHGGFLLAFALIAAFGGGSLLEAAFGDVAGRQRALARFVHWAGVGVAILGLTALNPYGFGLHLHLLGLLGDRAILDVISEFRSPDFHQRGAQVYAAVAMLFLVAILMRRPRPRPVEWLLPCALFVGSLVSVRHGVLFALVSAPWAARAIETLLREAARGSGAIVRAIRGLLRSSDRLAVGDGSSGGVVPVALLAFAAVTFRAADGRDTIVFDPAYQPVEAADFVERRGEDLPGRMFNGYAWGGYLAYRFFPERRVFIHGLNDHYGSALLRDYLDVVELRAGWRAVLDRHRIGHAIVATDSALAAALSYDVEWTVVHEDPLAVVLTRLSVPNDVVEPTTD